LSYDGQNPIPLKIRSIVGLTPLFAISTIRKEQLDILPDFKKRMTWLKDYRSSHNLFLPYEERSEEQVTLLSLVHKDRLCRLLERLLDEDEFLSPNGIRSVSRYYADHPYTILLNGEEHMVQYDPGDSTSGLYGGNSNWRGPVWMPVNYLFIKALQKYGDFYGDSFTVEYPKGSGLSVTLKEVAAHLSQRIISLFCMNENNQRKIHGKYNWFYQREENKELLLFYEFFHGETGQGLGASHQTGWTGLIANLVSGM
ncbi:MAG TPA: glucosidase, partial [Flavisolibacter sp.]|nr:glucosidase [Flavisolibacter sp.]